MYAEETERLAKAGIQKETFRHKFSQSEPKSLVKRKYKDTRSDKRNTNYPCDPILTLETKAANHRLQAPYMTL